MYAATAQVHLQSLVATVLSASTVLSMAGGGEITGLNTVLEVVRDSRTPLKQLITTAANAMTELLPPV